MEHKTKEKLRAVVVSRFYFSTYFPYIHTHSVWVYRYVSLTRDRHDDHRHLRTYAQRLIRIGSEHVAIRNYIRVLNGCPLYGSNERDWNGIIKAWHEDKKIAYYIVCWFKSHHTPNLMHLFDIWSMSY